MNTENTEQPLKKWAHEQALASASIEGHEPSAEFLHDSDELQAGRITADEFQARVARRAAALQTAADRNG